MKVFKSEITTHEFEGIFDGFYVEVQQKELTELYLCHKEYGIKMYMFDCQAIAEECEIENIIATNIEEYIDTYTDKFFD